MKSLIFTNHHVELILSGRKTETRRIVKDPAKSPCQPGDLVWVREAFWQERNAGELTGRVSFLHPWMTETGDTKWHKMSPIFLPRDKSRLSIEVTGCRLERLLDMSVESVEREGYPETTVKSFFYDVWDVINPETPAYTDPPVWVVEFRVAGATG